MTTAYTTPCSNGEKCATFDFCLSQGDGSTNIMETCIEGADRIQASNSAVAKAALAERRCPVDLIISHTVLDSEGAA